MAGSARQYHTQQTHFLRIPVTLALNNGVAPKGGTIPAGSKILRTTYFGDVAFNAGTNNNLNIGFTANGTDLVNAQSIAGAAPLTSALTQVAAGQQVATDTDVFAQYNQSGTAATTGSGTVVIEYVPNI